MRAKTNLSKSMITYHRKYIQQFCCTVIGCLLCCLLSTNMELQQAAAMTTISNSASDSVIVTRGSYLQMLTDTSIIIRWRTNLPADSKVWYGNTTDNLAWTSNDSALVIDHSVAINGLQANTKYYYAIGTSTDTLQSDSSYYFITAPPIGSKKPTRIWATGDCGTGYTTQTNVLNAYQNYTNGQYTDLWLLLGDNAYTNGHDWEYQSHFFEPYMQGYVMRQTAIFPTPGNHDYYNTTDPNSTDIPYFHNFTLPTQSEVGGIASGTEAYYSFDYANIHFISLNSYGKVNGLMMHDTIGAQIEWLKSDLENNQQQWTVLYWHHPPYTMGSHNSDTELDLVYIRERVIPILDRYKVDLVLCGHSHCYERSKLMHGHYGMEETFDSYIHNASHSSGAYNNTPESCPYIKDSNNSSNEGIVYVVAGSAGKLSGTQGLFPHNAMYIGTAAVAGSLLIEVDGKRLDAKFITEAGVVYDQFTMMKDVNKSIDTLLCQGNSIVLSASWKGDYLWSNGSTAQSITVSPTSPAVYSVVDGSNNCLVDNIHVNVAPSLFASSAVCHNEIRQYSTPSISGATYQWTVVGGTIVGGQGTNTVEVLWNGNGNGSVSVTMSY